MTCRCKCGNAKMAEMGTNSFGFVWWCPRCGRLCAQEHPRIRCVEQKVVWSTPTMLEEGD